jgi:ribose transport system ATP-binding protein
LVGENGAGKSTLMKILAGVYQPDEGTVVLDGAEVAMSDPLRAQKLGVGIVHQELSIFPTLSVAENIFANRQPGKSGFIDFPAMYAEAESLLSEFQLGVKPTTQAGTLSVSEQQVVEIIKAVSLQPKVLILDEPTSALSEAEIERLFEILAKLKSKGIGMIYISHKLKEIFALADRITVLRDGGLVGEVPAGEANENQIIEMMVGRETSAIYPEKNVKSGKRTVMEARNVKVPGKVGIQ